MNLLCITPFLNPSPRHADVLRQPNHTCAFIIDTDFQLVYPLKYTNKHGFDTFEFN